MQIRAARIVVEPFELRNRIRAQKRFARNAAPAYHAIRVTVGKLGFDRCRDVIGHFDQRHQVCIARTYQVHDIIRFGHAVAEVVGQRAHLDRPGRRLGIVTVSQRVGHHPDVRNGADDLQRSAEPVALPDRDRQHHERKRKHDHGDIRDHRDRPDGIPGQLRFDEVADHREGEQIVQPPEPSPVPALAGRSCFICTGARVERLVAATHGWANPCDRVQLPSWRARFANDTAPFPQSNRQRPQTGVIASERRCYLRRLC